MINLVALQGRLTYPPELKSTPTGKSILRFQIACDRNYQSQGKDRQADFIDCVAFEKTAEFIHRYFNKGSMIALEGRIQTSNYTDKDGNMRKSTEVVAVNVSFCESKKDETQPNVSVPTSESSYEVIDDDDDLPF